ncbi:hypothetical protein RSOL_325100 [Rhizoctonia solani AG-3 Rhs1AP]|uniref:Uncharacterized protein n=1 Tax=Rhizoctonia solani AG-3 Rhs1AP TaxID=1086054 RepID=A0A0A1ULA0_9AGAM|nr:hypothetical protein RSOL_325100 [Rhizoctonia solani AG-3 Rhs1AP]
MDTKNMDERLFQEFLEFKAFKLAAEAKLAKETQSGEFDSTNQISDPVSPVEKDVETRQGQRSLVVGRSSDSVEPFEGQASMSPRLSSPEITQDTSEYYPESLAQGEASCDTSLESLSRSPTPEPTDTGYHLRPWDPKVERNLSLHLSTLSSPKRHRSPSPQAGPSKRSRSASFSSLSSDLSDSPPPASHPYDTCPTSYKKTTGKRGARYRIVINGKREVKHTPMERLAERKAKYKRVRKHGHLFGDKHKCYFNPYSYSPISKKHFKRIVKPVGVRVCRGGPLSQPVHELIGLRDDYEYRLQIGTAARKALTKFLPDNFVLKPGEQLSYCKHYDMSARTQINGYMYKQFPFLYHFRDESGDDNWVIDAICTSYLYSNSMYVKAGNLSADIYLKRNASSSKGQDDELADESEEEGMPSGYEDDYALNARVSSTTAYKRSRPSGSYKKPVHSGEDESRSSKKRRGDLEERGSSRSVLFPHLTLVEDKVAASERLQGDTFGARADVVGVATPARSIKKEIQSPPIASISKDIDVKLENDDSEAELIGNEGYTIHSLELTPILPPKERTTTPPKVSGTDILNNSAENCTQEPEPQSTPSTLRAWLSSFTFGIWR